MITYLCLSKKFIHSIVLRKKSILLPDFDLAFNKFAVMNDKLFKKRLSLYQNGTNMLGKC